MSREDFFSTYLAYTSGNEAPTFFHRWAAIASVGALLGRRFYIEHGQFRINPNIYCMLIGNAGTKKSTAIKIARKLVQSSGYQFLGPKKITKEKFFIKLAEQSKPQEDDILDMNLFGSPTDQLNESQMFIAADEFNEFFGNDVMSFVSTLGDMWDWEGPYENEVKNSTSSYLYNPTISILGGNTPTGFAEAFPSRIIGQGFFSRLLLVYAEPSGVKITWPRRPTDEETAQILEWLFRFQQLTANVSLTAGARLLLDKIYQNWKGVDDVRFESYSNRRFAHLLKLCLIHTAVRLGTSIQEDDIVYANTVLTHTEHLMPKALGEFGKARNADVSHKVIQVIDSGLGVVSQKDIWKNVHNDLETMNQLGELLRNLVAAEKIQMVKGGFLPRKRVVEEVSNDVLDYNFLTATERNYTK
jgi:hypothetical protein